MDNLIKTFYDEKTDGRYMPVGLGSFGQVCLEQPLVMCVYCGFVERFGLNNLQILKQLADACAVYSAFQIKLITLKANKEALDKNLETSNEAYDKQLKLLEKKNNDLKDLCKNFGVSFEDDNDAGMLVNSDRITLKIREIQSNISDKQDLATERAKFEFQIRKFQSDIDMLTQKIEKYCVQFRKLLEVFSVKNIDNIQRFANGDEKEVDKLLLCGVATTNDMFRERFGGAIKIDDAKIKTKPFIKFVQSYFTCLLTMADYTAELNKKISDGGKLDKKDLMIAKRLEAVSKSYQLHLSSDRGMKFVYANLPANFDGKQKAAFKLYSKQIEISLNEKSNTNLFVNRQLAFDMAQKYSDPFIVAVATAIDDMCTKNFNISTVEVGLDENVSLDEDATNAETEETIKSEENNLNKELSDGSAEMDETVNSVEKSEGEADAAEGGAENAEQNAAEGGDAGAADANAAMPNMGGVDPSMMQGGMAVDPNTGMPYDPNMMQNGFADPNQMMPNMGGFDPNMMQGGMAMDPNTGMPYDPSMMQNGFADPNQMMPNMGGFDPNMPQGGTFDPSLGGMPFNGGFDPNAGM